MLGIFIRFDWDSLLYRGEKVRLHQVESQSSSDEPPADARAAQRKFVSYADVQPGTESLWRFRLNFNLKNICNRFLSYVFQKRINELQHGRLSSFVLKNTGKYSVAKRVKTCHVGWFSQVDFSFFRKIILPNLKNNFFQINTLPFYCWISLSDVYCAFLSGVWDPY